MEFAIVDYYLIVIVDLYMGRNDTRICCYIAINLPN